MTKKLTMDEYVGAIEIDGVTVYVMRRSESIVYITVDMSQQIPVGIVVQVPEYSEPYIYFDELEGPTIFPYFGKNMYYYNVNWNQNAEFLKIKHDAHRTLNQLIVDEYKEPAYLELWTIEI